MQHAIGFFILAIIMLLSAITGYRIGQDKYHSDDFEEKWLKQSICTVVWTVTVVIISYTCIGIIGLILWLIAFIGIWLCQFIQWLAESLMTPFQVLADSLT